MGFSNTAIKAIEKKDIKKYLKVIINNNVIPRAKILSYNYSSNKDFASDQLSLALDNSYENYSNVSWYNVVIELYEGIVAGGQTEIQRKFYGYIRQIEYSHSGSQNIVNITAFDILVRLSELEIEEKFEASKTKVSLETPTPNFIAFYAVINGVPTATSVTYASVENESTLQAGDTLYNVTRSYSERTVVSVDTDNSIITTSSSSDTWADTDEIVKSTRVQVLDLANTNIADFPEPIIKIKNRDDELEDPLWEGFQILYENGQILLGRPINWAEYLIRCTYYYYPSATALYVEDIIEDILVADDGYNDQPYTVADNLTETLLNMTGNNVDTMRTNTSAEVVGTTTYEAGRLWYTSYGNILTTLTSADFTVPGGSISSVDLRYGRIILASAISTSATVTCNTNYSFNTLQPSGIQLTKIEFSYENTSNRLEAINKLIDLCAPNYVFQTKGSDKIWLDYVYQKDTSDYTAKNIINLCVDEKTEALTKNGWKKYNEINKNDELFTLNINNGKAEWNKIKKINIYDKHKEEMIYLSGQSFDALVTPNHKWPIQYERVRYGQWENWGKWYPSKDLKNKFILKRTDEFNSIYHIPRCANIDDINNNVNNEIYSDEFVSLIGWFVTERCIQYYTPKRLRKNNKYYKQYINIAQSYKVNFKKCKIIKEILDKLKYPYNMLLGSHNTYRFNIKDNGVKDILSVAPNKELTIDFIMNLTHRQRIILINSMISGDGHIDKYGYKIYLTNNKKLADIFQMLLSLSGIASNYRLKLSNNVYKISLLETKFATTKSLKKDKIIYTGKVWCPSIENQTFLARRNGITYFTGNSKSEDVEVYTRVRLFGQNSNPQNILYDPDVSVVQDTSEYYSEVSNQELTFSEETGGWRIYDIGLGEGARIISNYEGSSCWPVVYVNNIPIDDDSHELLMQQVEWKRMEEYRQECHSWCTSYKVRSFRKYWIYFSHSDIDPDQQIIFYNSTGVALKTLSANDSNMNYGEGYYFIDVGEGDASWIQSVSTASYHILYSTGKLEILWNEGKFKVHTSMFSSNREDLVTATFTYSAIYTAPGGIERLIDGRFTTQVQTEFNSKPSSGFVWAIIDLGSVQEADAIDLIGGFFIPDNDQPSRRFNSTGWFTVQYSPDDVDDSDDATFYNLSANSENFKLEGGESKSWEREDLGNSFELRYIKIIVEDLEEISYNEGIYVVSFSELAIYKDIVLSESAFLTSDVDLEDDNHLYDVDGLLSSIGDKLYKVTTINEELSNTTKLQRRAKALLREFTKNNTTMTGAIVYGPHYEVGQTLKVIDNKNNINDNYFIESIGSSNGMVSLGLARYPRYKVLGGQDPGVVEV